MDDVTLTDRDESNSIHSHPKAEPIKILSLGLLAMEILWHQFEFVISQRSSERLCLVYTWCDMIDALYSDKPEQYREFCHIY